MVDKLLKLYRFIKCFMFYMSLIFGMTFCIVSLFIPTFLVLEYDDNTFMFLHLFHILIILYLIKKDYEK